MRTTKPLQTALDTYRRELSHVVASLEAEIARLQRIEAAYAETGITAAHMRTTVRTTEGLSVQVAEIATDLAALAAKAEDGF